MPSFSVRHHRFWKHLGTALIGAASLLVSRASFAGVDGFWVWTPDPVSGIHYVLPKVRGRAPEQLARSYQIALKKSSIYGKMENVNAVTLSTDRSTFAELPVSSPEHPNVAVVLNRPNQMTSKSRYVGTVFRSFQHEGPRLFAIPIGLETVLSPSEMKEFRSQLNGMDGLLGVGGDDPHPMMYHQSDTSRTRGDISLERDTEQTAYITEYLKNGKGRVFVICGSMQRAAIADGHGFYDDISHVSAGVHEGRTGPVLVEVEAEPGSELATAAGATRFKVSSYHHAAVNPTLPQNPGHPPSSRVSGYAVEPDGSRGRVVEAIEFPHNAGWGVQFHAEFRGSPEEARIVRYVAAGWKLRGRYSPSAIARCMLMNLGSEYGTSVPSTP